MRRLEAFRGERARLPLHRAECQLIVVLAAHLCFLPWALGTMHVWSQWVSFGLAIFELGLALRARSHEERERRRPLSQLLHFPVFWIGLLFLVYLAIQGLNPSLRYTRTEVSWWLESVKNIPWLPTSIEAPFETSNPWRQLVIYGSSWMVACSAWVGLTRRRSWRILLVVLATNAVALGAVLLIQRAAGDGRLPGPLGEFTERSDLTATFVYHNHAGTYLGLMTFAAVALATWGYDQGVRTQKKSTPAAALALLALFLVGSVLFTLSRGASIVLAGMLSAFALWAYMRHRLRPVDVGSDSRVTIVLSVFFVAFVLFIVRSIDFSSVYNRFDALIQGRSAGFSVHSRMEAREAGLALLEDHGLRGLGSGGFRHLFPEYVCRYPDIYERGHLFWEHVHNDWLEFPIELGLAGMLILAAMAGYWLTLLFRSRAVWHSSMVPILFGCLGTLLHAWIDFPFQCPAILVTWCFLVTMACRYLSLEVARRAR